MYEDDEVSSFLDEYEDENIKIVIEVAPDYIPGILFHHTLKRFSKSAYKSIKEVMKQICDGYEKNGIHCYAMVEGDVKIRWAEAFSFEDTGLKMEGCTLLRYRYG